MKMLKLIALANEFVLAGGKEMPATIPVKYGTYPYGKADIGKGRKIDIDQVFDFDSAAAIANECAGILAKGGKGIPVYQGHADVPELAAKYPLKAATGWITACKPLANEAEVTVRWLANPGEGFAFFSPYWTGPLAIANEKGVMKIRSMLSLALTNDPNIDAFRLPNESPDDEDDYTDTSAKGGSSLPAEQKGIQNMDIKELAKALGLDPEKATAEQVMAKIKELVAVPAQVTALENEVTKQKTACANERKARIALLVGAAVADGRVSGADKPVWETRLANEAAFDAEVVVLANMKPALKLAPVVAPKMDTKQHNSLLKLANEKQAANPTWDWDRCWQAVKAENPDKFAAKPNA